MFTCFVRYQVEPDKLSEFREYARSWIALIRKYGGTHHGYFVPGTSADDLPEPTFSFPGIEAYDRYRRDVAADEACKAATARFNESKCFTSYERTFLLPVFE